METTTQEIARDHQTQTEWDTYHATGLDWALMGGSLLAVVLLALWCEYWTGKRRL